MTGSPDMKDVSTNFARIRQTLRMTPAMAAGVTKHGWEIEKIFGQLGRRAQVMRYRLLTLLFNLDPGRTEKQSTRVDTVHTFASGGGLNLAVLFRPAAILGGRGPRGFSRDISELRNIVDEFYGIGRTILDLDLATLELAVRGDSVTAEFEDILGATLDSIRASQSFLSGHSGRQLRSAVSTALPEQAPGFLLLFDEVTERLRHVLALLAAILGEPDENALQESGIPRAPSGYPPGPSVPLDL